MKKGSLLKCNKVEVFELKDPVHCISINIVNFHPISIWLEVNSSNNDPNSIKLGIPEKAQPNILIWGAMREVILRILKVSDKRVYTWTNQ